MVTYIFLNLVAWSKVDAGSGPPAIKYSFLAMNVFQFSPSMVLGLPSECGVWMISNSPYLY